MAELIQVETGRLFLRQSRSSDRLPFAELNADQEVMRYFPSTLSRQKSDAMADLCESLIERRGWGFWAVEVKADKCFIGFVGLHIPTTELPFSPCVEIGWRLSSLYWGNGYATEAANTALQVGFEMLKLPEIVAFTAVGNFRSRAVMKRLGMIESASTFKHPAVPIDSWLQEHCLYRIAREKWIARNS
ncbi:GNAT family N-acetyltransferase [Azotobacter salinestris]|uniref:GNAT family N-acetyltransferase n=1 Tax=Azotobacter salinestris TaxID=69964 RepID=UPI0032DEAD82